MKVAPITCTEPSGVEILISPGKKVEAYGVEPVFCSAERRSETNAKSKQPLYASPDGSLEIFIGPGTSLEVYGAISVTTSTDSRTAVAARMLDESDESLRDPTKITRLGSQR